MANILLDGISNRKESILDLHSKIVIVEDNKLVSQGTLNGETFCITGTLSRPRKEIALSIKAQGGKVVSSVSGNLDFLVSGDSSGSKMEKATRMGVKIINEDELYELLGGGILADIPIQRQLSLGEF